MKKLGKKAKVHENSLSAYCSSACTCLTITCTCSSTSHDPTGNYFQGDDFYICFLFAEPRAKSMPQVVAGKVWNNDRLPSLFFGIYHFFRIVILQNPFDCSVDCLRIMDITETVTENEARHTINYSTIKTIFFLHLVFLFESLINRIHHWNSPNTRFCLWK